MHTCPACGRDNLTFTGLGQHLAKSRDPRCQALYSQSHELAGNLKLTAAEDSDMDEENEHAEIFDGEYFVDETHGEAQGEEECEMEWRDEAQKSADSDSDDEIAAEPEWEPPAPDPAGDWPQAEEDHGTNARLLVQEHAQGQHGYDNPYFPFCSQTEWEIARWSKLRGPSSTAFTDLLAIEGVPESLGLSFKNAKELNAIIDHELPTGRPKFKHEQIVVAGEAFDVYYRDVIECVKALYSDPDFAEYLTFIPERHYVDEDQTTLLFHDMYTGKWWWDTQKKLDQHCPGGMIILIIISSDKTQVTMFRNKAAYPVYLTIGNIPKEICRKPSRSAHILLAYLPTTHLEHISNKASRRCTMANLYHACMSRVLAPLESAGLDGVKIRSGDGALRRCHPLFACFIGDYPEQLLATGVKFGECPKYALATLDQGNLDFVHACAAAGIKPVIHPFWEDLPFTNIFRVITPDILHQLYQGLVKHLISWLSEACRAAEIDAQCRRLPSNHNIQLFTKGITTLLRICRFLLGIIVDIHLPNNLNAGHLLRAVRGLLDFLYLTQFPCHSSETLELLQEALDLHATHHYSLMIAMFGTTDNYNTEYTERLHIDLAKDAYRATNHKDEFVQMTIWLERKEKILRHEKYICWRLSGGCETFPCHSRPPDMTHCRVQVMTKHPSAKAVSIQKLVDDYGATHFREALACYIARHNSPNDSQPLRGHALDDLASDVHFPFRTLPVFHKIKWLSSDTRGHGEASVTVDSVHARPQRHSGSCLVARRSDTALVCLRTGAAGLEDFCVGQVCAIFVLPPASIPILFPPTFRVPTHLAYIEWFTPFPPAPDRNHEQVASIVSVANIVSSTHLILRFGAIAPWEWTSNTVLEDCETFWLNLYLDRHTFARFK
ncbi:hypothetical protein F4604DRAFT_1879992 [Suillus subluteus]|nr:hypothetical protein F4604DRAFT_1879992 [Suillus subluteus]